MNDTFLNEIRGRISVTTSIQCVNGYSTPCYVIEADVNIDGRHALTTCSELMSNTNAKRFEPIFIRNLIENHYQKIMRMYGIN